MILKCPDHYIDVKSTVSAVLFLFQNHKEDTTE